MQRVNLGLLALLLTSCLGLGLFSIPLTGDQKVYLSTAMEMWQDGSWLFPRLFGDYSFYKPPILYWLILGSWKVFGFGHFGSLLPSVLGILGTCLGLARLGRLLGLGPKQSDYGGLMYGVTLGALTFGTTAQMEILHGLFWVWAWVLGLRYLRGDGLKFLYGALLIAGATSLVKSPLYSVFWVVSFWSYLLVLPQFRTQWARPHLWIALVVGILVGLFWFVLAHFGVENDLFWEQYVKVEHYAKRGGNWGKAYQIWLTLLGHYLAPFSLMILPPLMGFLGRVVRPAKLEAFDWVLLVWMIWPGVFFSLYPYKVNTYLFPLLPPLCLLLGRTLGSHLTLWDHLASKLTGMVGLVFCLGCSWILAPFVNTWILTLLVLTALMMGWGFGTAKPQRIFAAALLLCLSVRLVGVHLGEQDLQDLRALQDEGTTFSYFDPGKNPWHEVGLIASALKTPFERIHERQAFVQSVRGGRFGVLSNEDYQRYFDNSPPEGLRVLTWTRWARKGRVSRARLMRRDQLPSELKRSFFILTR